MVQVSSVYLGYLVYRAASLLSAKASSSFHCLFKMYVYNVHFTCYTYEYQAAFKSSYHECHAFVTCPPRCRL
ncbi:Uncharacterized protein HZ326_17203 [Fusarium oxysporum f. sp. albedinis]|nr:Uncharacterized protein HZ326_17203 [Fusarium oxysporum f. sp. albedinis]